MTTIAERQIDDCLFQLDEDGRLAMLQAELTTFFTAHELYCLLVFVRVEGVAGIVARLERRRQQAEWDRRV